MVGVEEESKETPTRLVDALRATERGVWYFLLFAVLMIAGFALVMAGHLASGAVAGILAFVFLMAMILTPPSHALPPGEPGMGDNQERAISEEKAEVEEESEAEKLSREAAPAPTRATRQAPAPPPEPPSEDEIVVDLE